MQEQGKELLKAIDDYIDLCKEEIRLRRNKDKGKKRTDHFRDENSAPDFLEAYKGSRRFGFNAVLRDLYGEGFIESFKAYRKRIDNSKASQSDFDALQRFYNDMVTKFHAGKVHEHTAVPASFVSLPNEFIDLPENVENSPENIVNLPGGLLDFLSEKSDEFDQEIDAKKKRK
ncbi:MAG: hypothetical protein GX801_09550 [Fibrobacter sp.]|nr:hypothetical protein [Fibrobacter sp.]